MTIGKIDIISHAYALIAFIITMLLLPFYYGGDQHHYNKFWENLNNISILDVPGSSLFYIGSLEPGYAFLSYFASFVTTKTIFSALVNYLITYIVFRWLASKRIALFLAPFYFSNFYVLVIFLAAERLRLALLFILIALCYRRLRFLVSVALITHVTSIMLLVPIYILNKFNYRIHVIRKKTLSILLFIVIPFLTLVWIFLGEYILIKLSFYREGKTIDMLGFLKVSVFCILAMFHSALPTKTFVAFLPLMICATILGPERVVIFAFFILIFVLIQSNHWFSPFLILVCLYFSFKGFVFIQNVIEYGNGFHFESIR